MSQDRDLERDMRFAAELGGIPAPAMPAGLTARIVQNATRLPQHGSVAPAVIGTAATAVASSPLRRRHWLPLAIGTAVAASLLAAFFIQQGPGNPVRPAAPVQVAQTGPAPVPVTAVDAAAAASLGAQRDADSARTAAKAAAVPTKPDQQPHDPSDTAAPEPQPGQDARPETQAPLLASKPPAPGPASKPIEQALVGPPDTDDLGATLPQGSPASGFGISGAGVPDMSVPPAPRGGRSGGVPRF